jgi:peptidoglycan/LPS O-acetylase OafA/YrhL
LGEWSFSLYLLHPLVLYFVFEPLRKIPIDTLSTPQKFLQYLIICFLILIVVSALTYRWIEKPSIDLGRRLTRWAKYSCCNVTLNIKND